jgi:hypothetical protein
MVAKLAPTGAASLGKMTRQNQFLSCSTTWNFEYDDPSKCSFALFVCDYKPGDFRAVARLTIPLSWFEPNTVVKEVFPMKCGDQGMEVFIEVHVHMCENREPAFLGRPGGLLVKPAWPKIHFDAVEQQIQQNVYPQYPPQMPPEIPMGYSTPPPPPPPPPYAGPVDPMAPPLVPFSVVLPDGSVQILYGYPLAPTAFPPPAQSYDGDDGVVVFEEEEEEEEGGLLSRIDKIDRAFIPEVEKI